ncbi:hydrogenase subunit [Methanospirillum purgamenti]|jgi:hydrogenase-4 component E|uniref:Hydrogenase subunit n=1 Tax=Methanospirillum hungatei TaxID=2203 RepID=A0A8F5VK57_METHU|nr:hydrogenase subunit [Methanospirillum hungatei]QXO94324.1 hydrogenase subunit [Methanospirillum hungatei]
MITPESAPVLVRISLVLVLVSAAFLLSSRNLPNLVRIYQLQSLLLVIIAVFLAGIEDHALLFLVAGLTFISKVWGIPTFIRMIQQRIQIHQDIRFSYLHPAGALIVSILIILLVYTCFSRILDSLYESSSLFFLGSVIGVSMVLMGLIAVFSRKMAITKVIGYLSMENGVLLFGMFVTELPFIIEFVIMVDLIILVLLTSILTVGIDSSIEEYKERMQEFHLFTGEEAVQ